MPATRSAVDDYRIRQLGGDIRNHGATRADLRSIDPLKKTLKSVHRRIFCRKSAIFPLRRLYIGTSDKL